MNRFLGQLCFDMHSPLRYNELMGTIVMFEETAGCGIHLCYRGNDKKDMDNVR